MASCRACGAGVGRQFRFCSQCGSAVGVELDLLDLAPPAHDEASVTYGRPGRFWVAVVGGVVAVLLGLWALSSIGGGDARGGAGDEAAARRPTTTVGARAATTTSPASESPPSDGATTTATTGAPATNVLAGGGPFQSEPLGLSLIIGSEERLRRLDLDTGVVTTYERVGTPLVVSGGWVLIQGGNGLARALPVSDLDAEVASVWSQSSTGLPLPGPVPGQIWLPDADGPTLTWRLVDPSTRKTVQELDSGVAAWWQQPESVLDPMVVGSTTGQVFERDGETFRPVAMGELVGVGRTVVLVRRCTDPRSCTLHWIDRSTWRDTTAPVPADRAGEVTAASVSDDGRLLLYSTASESFLYDVSRGREVAQVAAWPGGVLSVSPDGRWAVVVHTAGRIALYDVERGETTEVGVSSSSQGQVVIVPTA